jgi:hypothetical protein
MDEKEINTTETTTEETPEMVEELSNGKGEDE